MKTEEKEKINKNENSKVTESVISIF